MKNARNHFHKSHPIPKMRVIPKIMESIILKRPAYVSIYQLLKAFQDIRYSGLKS